MEETERDHRGIRILVDWDWVSPVCVIVEWASGSWIWRERG